ncbi:MAG: hypothetical protein MOB07_09700 [Acidobacteria bacterium]|nr:hypothetical protein [Acidobacteriota bacterium]
MTSIGFVLALTLFLQSQNPNQTVPVRPTAADVLRATLQAFFNIQGIPVGAFVDAQGKILDRWVGFKDEKVFVERVRRLMGE